MMKFYILAVMFVLPCPYCEESMKYFLLLINIVALFFHFFFPYNDDTLRLPYDINFLSVGWYCQRHTRVNA